MAKGSKIFSTPSRKVTEADMTMFANTFLSSLLKGRDEKAHAAMILPLMDGLVLHTPEWYDELLRIRKNLVGNATMTTDASLGWNNLKMFRPLKADDTITMEMEILEARASKSKQNMAIFNVRYSIFNQYREEIAEVDHTIGIW